MSKEKDFLMEKLKKYLDGLEEQMPLVAKEKYDYLVYESKRDAIFCLIFGIICGILFFKFGDLDATRRSLSGEALITRTLSGLGVGLSTFFLYCNLAYLDELKRTPKSTIYKFFRKGSL